MTIIDRRAPKSHKNAENRKKFIDRHKESIKRAVKESIQGKNITDVDKDIDISIPDIKEHSVDYDKDSGNRERVISGNNEYLKGDQIPKPEDEGYGQGSGKGEGGEDEFTFTLTKEEFYELYFEDMDLPEFVKESKIDTTDYQIKRAGYIREGLPCRLDVKKTMEMALARKISSTSENTPFIDDVDLRFRHYKPVPVPMRQAVIFFLMDVSASMGDHHKMLSKKFFIFLYLFITKNYEKVQVRFIRYHSEASDVDEQTFFYSQETGGTCVVDALMLTKSIIEAEYNLANWNIYIAHTSDGDFGWGEKESLPALIAPLLSMVQYYAYLQVMTGDEAGYKQYMYTLADTFKEFEDNKKCNQALAIHPDDIFPVLHNLFKKRR